MKSITFDQASLLIGTEGVTILNESHEVITSWKQLLSSKRYYTQQKNIKL